MSSSSECPLCFEHFPVSVLERHASGCSGKKETRATVKNNDSQIRAKPVEAKKRSLPVESDCVEENHGGSPNVGAKKRGRIEEANGGVPLAEQMRPIDLSSFVGQPEVTGDGSVFRNLLFRDEIPSVVLWGPPGCGKTSLANVIAHRCRAGNRYRFVKLSACTAGVADVKDVVRAAKNELKLTRRRTVLFVDEVHRFNKLQQDVFLPHVEDGTLILVGATTENPSFSLNSALLSRCRVIVLEKLSPENIMEILRRAAEAKNLVVVSNNEDVETSSTRGDKWISEEALDYLAHVADGDARTALNCLQMAMGAGNEGAIISVESIKHSLKRAHLLYDRKGDQHFDCISALHKSIRGSDDNAAIYWCTRMLAGGEDPLYVARRLVRIAGEDVGLGDPSALPLAVAAMQGCQLLGKPECDVLLAEAAVYLARAKKSHEVYHAMVRAQQSLTGEQGNLPPVPLHLRNAPTKLAKNLGYGVGYSSNLAEVKSIKYMPEGMEDTNFFSQESREATSP